MTRDASADNHIRPAEPLAKRTPGGRPLRLLDQVRARIRVKRYSFRTEQTCLDWITRVIKYGSSDFSVGNGTAAHHFSPRAIPCMRCRHSGTGRKALVGADSRRNQKRIGKSLAKQVQFSPTGKSEEPFF